MHGPLRSRLRGRAGTLAGHTNYDTVVVGGGHNGLTAAAHLSRAGKKVLVLEARSTVGGFCVTEATVPEAPGYLMNPYAADFAIGNIHPRSTWS